MKNYRTIIVLIFATILGAYFRFHSLGGPNFWVDEFLHVFAAKGLLTVHKPVFPTGILYDRSIIVTIFTAISFKLFGISELAARLPGAVVGTALIPLVYFLSKKYVGEKTALIAAIFVAFDPFSFWWSRLDRMYIYFEVSFFAAAAVLFSILIKPFKPDIPTMKKWGLFIVLLLLAISFQNLGLLIAVAGAVFMVFGYLLKITERKNNLLYYSVAALVLFTYLFVLFRTKSLVPADYYLRYGLNNIHPAFIYLLVASFAYCLWRKNAFGIYSGVIFAVILWTHTLVATSPYYPFFTHTRYVIEAYPFGYLTLAVPLGDGAYYLLKGRKQWLKNVALALSLVLVTFFGYKMIKHAYIMKITDEGLYKQAANYIKESPRYKKTDIVISTYPPASYYYLGKTDYLLRTMNYKGKVFWKNGKERELYTGAILINNLSDLKKVLGKRKAWIFTEARLNLWVDPRTRTYVERMQKLHADKRNTAVVYYYEGKAVSR